MTAAALPIRFQIGARTLWSVRRRLQRVALSLDEALAGHLPSLSALDAVSDGFLVTSLPETQLAAARAAGTGLLPFVRQRYDRHYVDLGIGFDAFLAGLSANARSGLRRKTKKLTAASGGALDVRGYRSAAELLEFHALARPLSQLTYQEALLDAGLPDSPAFMRDLVARGESDRARAWLLFLEGKPVAYLYCGADGDTLRYDYLGHDPAVAHLSAGTVLQIEAMRRLFAERRFARFDFTEGEGQHKRTFATASVPCLDVLLLRPTLANRALIAGVASFDRAAALAKRAIHRVGAQALARRVRRA